MAIIEDTTSGLKKYDPKKSIKRAKTIRALDPKWKITLDTGEYLWTTRMERLTIIRQGLPYDTFEEISKRANLPIKHILLLFDIPQTTYNKKKRDRDLLSGRDSEIVLVLIELLDYGLDVFNYEREKFHRWLKKPNISLGGASPKSLFDSLTGIQEVRNSLNRLEHGQLA